MKSTLKLVSIGNSKGVRLPAKIIRRYHFEGEMQMIEIPEGILLKAVAPQKLSFAEAVTEMAREQDGMKEFLLWEENCVQDGLEDEEFAGWPR